LRKKRAAASTASIANVKGIDCRCQFSAGYKLQKFSVIAFFGSGSLAIGGDAARPVLREQLGR
jgi:hypothetical protein